MAQQASCPFLMSVRGHILEEETCVIVSRWSKTLRLCSRLGNRDHDPTHNTWRQGGPHPTIIGVLVVVSIFGQYSNMTLQHWFRVLVMS